MRDISGKDFSWDVQDLVDTTIKLNLVFDDPLEVSQEQADLLVIEFDASESFELAEKVIFIKPIPKLLPNSDFSKNVVESTNNAAQLSAGATATTALTQIAMSGALSQVWGLINGLQIFVHMPLLSIDLPSNG